MFVISNDSDLFKAGSHKYIKRTGRPGDYQYWYKDPSGRLVSHEGDAHNGARREHVKRLVSGKLRGAHAMSNAEMIAHTGIDAEKFRQIKSNLTSGGRTRHMDYSENELHEAKHSDVGSDEYNRKVESIKNEIESRGAAGSRPAAARASRSRATPAAAPARPAPAAPSRSSTPAAAATPAAPTETPAAKKERERLEKIAVLRAQLSSMFGLNLETPPASKPAPATPRVTTSDAQGAAQAEAMQASPRLDAGTDPAILARLGITQEQVIAASTSPRVVVARGSATAAQSQAREATAAARAELASPETATLHAASPELASADAPIAKMVKDQAAGKNPYVERAKKFYDKIKGDMTVKRKDSLGHLLNAIETAGHGANEAAVKAAYKTIQTAAGTGDSAWSEVKSHIEAGLFHAPEELIGNPPINVDMERMKRGFGRMQFERMKPFLGDAFTSAHPNAPGPYPTFDDLKTWDQHGSRPDFANSKKADGSPSGNTHTTKAVHEDFHKSMPKDADGKVLNPPGWMPLHMTPIWNYVASKDGAEAYAGSSLSSNEFNTSTQKINLASQGRFKGHLRNSLRKFIQMRGENSFADLPSYSKGRQQDIAKFYKSDSEAGFHRVMTSKVIPMAEFIKFHKEQSQTKKSFSLCVDENLGAVTFKKAFTIEDDMKKSDLISKIKNLKKSIGNKA